MDSETGTENLLEAARTGDPAALEALLERYQPRVYRFGMKMCRDQEDAEDVLQETLIAMARTIGDFRGASSVTTWLYTIARSFCIKKRRKSEFAPDHIESLDTEDGVVALRLRDAGRTPEEEAAGRQVQEALESAITSLDSKYREVLILRDIEGLTAREVAEVLDISVAASKSRLHRARVAVRDEIMPLLDLPEVAPAAASTGCPDVLTLFSMSLEGEISSERCAELERHLEGCGTCQGACESLQQTLALCRTGPSPQIPQSVRESVRTAVRAFLAESS